MTLSIGIMPLLPGFLYLKTDNSFPSFLTNHGWVLQALGENLTISPIPKSSPDQISSKGFLLDLNMSFLKPFEGIRLMAIMMTYSRPSFRISFGLPIPNQIGTSMTGRFAFIDDADIRFDVRIKRGHVFDEFAY